MNCAPRTKSWLDPSQSAAATSEDDMAVLLVSILNSKGRQRVYDFKRSRSATPGSTSNTPSNEVVMKKRGRRGSDVRYLRLEAVQVSHSIYKFNRGCA